MSCCRRNVLDENDEDYPMCLEGFKIIEIPNESIVDYKNSNFHTKKDNFIFKDKKYINNNMKWIKIESFKLIFMNNYIQCLNIKNRNTKNENKLVLFSQSSYTNLGSTLPFLLELSNYLKINILTYEYSNNKDEKQMNTDINILFCYLNKITSISEIILMGLSIGNIINMNIIISKIHKKINKIKSFIMISPTWKYNYVGEVIKNKKGGINKLKRALNTFFTTVNEQKINMFLIHGKQDNYVKYFLTLSLSQRIEYLSEWYPKNGTHFDIIKDYRAKLLTKLKFYLNNNYSLTSLQAQNNDNNKKQDIFNLINKNDEEHDKTLEEEDNSFQIFKENLNNLNMNDFEKEEYIIDDNSILYCENKSNMDKDEIMTFDEGDLIPTFTDKKNKKQNLLNEEDCCSFSSYKNK